MRAAIVNVNLYGNEDHEMVAFVRKDPNNNFPPFNSEFGVLIKRQTGLDIGDRRAFMLAWKIDGDEGQMIVDRETLAAGPVGMLLQTVKERWLMNPEPRVYSSMQFETLGKMASILRDRLRESVQLWTDVDWRGSADEILRNFSIVMMLLEEEADEREQHPERSKEVAYGGEPLEGGCAICHGDIPTNELPAPFGSMVTSCPNGHMFHATCIREWRRDHFTVDGLTTCPMCRSLMQRPALAQKRVSKSKSTSKSKQRQSR